MHTTVTAAQLASELQITTSRLPRWLRKERDASHPLVAVRPPGAPWMFSRQDADQVAEAFLASAGQVSDSEVQRRAEAVIRECLAEPPRRATGTEGRHSRRGRAGAR